jgi:hypothetical protein
MIDKNAVVLLRDVIAADKKYADAMLGEDTPVLCINRETKKDRLISFKTLYDNNSHFWQLNETWEYFLAKERLAKLEETLSPKPEPAADQPAPQGGVPMKNFGDEYEEIAAMTDAQRLERVQEGKKRLDALIIEKPRDGAKVTEALVDACRDTALVNQVMLMNAMQLADSEAKKLTQGLVDSTRAMVKASSQLVTPAIFNDELMHTLVEKSNGTVIQHMARVYLQGLSFLLYYNKLVSTSSIINRLRISFEPIYRQFYRSLLPHIHPDTLTLEKVFQGGMRAIPEKDFFNWATGFLIHDVGKAAAVEYHEGEAAYNRDIVVEHVKLGYTSVMNKTNYPKEAALITGYHHEYYGDPTGYGYFRAYLEQYKKANPGANPDCCISYELEPMLDYEALSFFPAKVLEIIDVYDSVTDPNRKYRKPMTPEEALAMMREEFIEKHRKIDLILFDIFAGFVREGQRK